MSGATATGEDLTGLSDLELIRMSQEGGPAPAAQTVLLRHLPWLNACVAGLARRHPLQAADLHDAQQQLALEVLTALPGYDGRCSLRTYMGRVFVKVLCRFLRRRHREDWMFGRSLQATGPPESAEGCRAAAEPASDSASDPAAIAAREETRAGLRRALAQLDPRARYVCEASANGWPLALLARELGLSLSQTKRLRRRALAHLAALLKERQTANQSVA
jgi:RNA polymerase sigma factor (sigma-70 family)